MERTHSDAKGSWYNNNHNNNQTKKKLQLQLQLWLWLMPKTDEDLTSASHWPSWSCWHLRSLYHRRSNALPNSLASLCLSKGEGQLGDNLLLARCLLLMRVSTCSYQLSHSGRIRNAVCLQLPVAWVQFSNSSAQLSLLTLNRQLFNR